MKQRFKNITDTSTKRRGVAALFAIVLIIALAGSTVYAAEDMQASYPDFDYTVVDNTAEGQDSPDSDMLSLDEAAEMAARYIYDIYGESIDGYAIWISFQGDRGHWAGRVTTSESRLVADEIVFSFTIDAASGKRIRIIDMRAEDTDLPDKTMTREEISKLDKQVPDNLAEFEQLAYEYAEKHFYDDEVASLNYNGMQIESAGRESAGVFKYKETLLSFVAADTTGRDAEIIIVMETNRLAEISDYVSEAERAAHRGEPAPGRSVRYSTFPTE